MDTFSRDGPASENTARLLRRLEFFQKIDFSALRTILSASRQFTLKRGRALFAENERANAGYVLLDGMIHLSSKSFGSATIVGAPAFIGESSLIVETMRQATAIAESNSTLIEITRLTFLRVIAEYPESAAALHKLLSQRLMTTLEGLEGVRAQFATAV